MPNLTDNWSAADLQTLKSLLADGRSFNFIALKLNRTRGAVASRVKRSRLKARSKPPKLQPLSYKPANPSAEFDAPDMNPRQLIDLLPEECRWPLGDPQTSDFFYCKHHHKIAYRP